MNTKKTAAVLAVLAALLAAAAGRGQSASFRFFGPLSRIVTPNGDGKNDSAFFCFDNPQFSDVSGKIYTLLGAEVASLGPVADAAATSCAALGSPAVAGSLEDLTWDGRSNGAVVRSGIYVYRITAEQHNYSGTLIVVR